MDDAPEEVPDPDQLDDANEAEGAEAEQFGSKANYSRSPDRCSNDEASPKIRPIAFRGGLTHARPASPSVD